MKYNTIDGSFNLPLSYLAISLDVPKMSHSNSH